jgi:glutathione S-transferase
MCAMLRATMTPRLITIPASHYCEKARWALTHARVDFEEERHVPMLHWRATLSSGGGRTVPVLVTDEGTLSDSHDIVRWADRRAPADRTLYPEGALEVDALERRFDRALGPAIRRLFYFHLMAHRRALDAFLAEGVPRHEAVFYRVARPLMLAIMRRGMNIDSAGAARSLAKVRTVFAEVDARLADGRRWLAADRFTAADLTFAALANAFVYPDECHWPRAPLDALPPAYAELVRDLRGTAAGRHALRVYRDARARTPHS